MRHATLILAALCTAGASAQTELVAPGLAPGARFGQSLAGGQECCELDQQAVLVGAPYGTLGAPGAQAGEVYTFRASENWAIAHRTPSPGQPGDLFGFSVDAGFLEYNGFLVGAPGAGQAYFYNDGVFGGSPARFRLDGSSLGVGSEFGLDVAGIGGNLQVGAPGAASGAGRVLVFPYQMSGDPEVSEPIQTLVPSHGSDRRFGHTLALNYGPYSLPGSANESRLAVGAPGRDGVPGAVYVYHLTAQTFNWSEMTRLEGPPGFGTAVTLYANVLAASSPQTGEVHLYRETPDGAWVPYGVLAAPPEFPASRLGGGGVGIVPSIGPGVRVLASAASLTAADPPAAPVLFVPYASGTAAEPTDVLVSSATGLYGTSLTTWPAPVIYADDFLWALGDPEAGGVGAAFVGDGTDFPDVPPPPVAPEPTPSEAAVSVRVFPTPTSWGATLRLGATGPVDVRVVDLLGRTVWHAHTVAPVDLTLDTSRLPSGLYGVHMVGKRVTATTRLVIAH